MPFKIKSFRGNVAYLYYFSVFKLQNIEGKT